MCFLVYLLRTWEKLETTPNPLGIHEKIQNPGGLPVNLGSLTTIYSSELAQLVSFPFSFSFS